MGILAREFFEAVEAIQRRNAPEQGGLLTGTNPDTWNPSDPFPLWVIQVVIILCFVQLLAFLFAKIRQPRVIAEVIGGIILGPTVMGRIPGFTSHIFPDNSIPVLTLTSTIGLVFFLFLIGLEVDVRLLRRNAKYALTISAAGMILPFGLGVAVAVPLYNTFIPDTTNFGHFLLFVGVAVAITAFPVLCRILTDLNLIDDHVGVIVLSAGVGNDVVGWILLALAVALTNATSGLSALWILLTGLAFVLFMLFPVRWAFVWLLRRTGPLDNGAPKPFMMTITLILILISAFFTDVIGIHPIFGGFIAGLVIPHEGGFAIALVEKLEDLVCIVFLPLYFVLSGLRTNLGLLNDGITWAYVVLICTVAFLGKFLGCAVSAKLMGFTNRESTAIGTLMSCKGLVELIVLNVGVQAGILNTRVFSMFVIHAIILTVLTTPLTLWCYPPKHRTRKGGKDFPSVDEEREVNGDLAETFKTRFSIILNRMEHLPAIMTAMQLIRSNGFATTSNTSLGVDIKSELKDGSEARTQHQLPISIDALRLVELTDRTSTVMRSSETEELIHRDPLISVFTSFGRLLNLPVSSSLSVVSEEGQYSNIATHVRNKGSQMIIIPWQAGHPAMPVEDRPASPQPSQNAYNPFQEIFGRVASSGNILYENFVRRVFAESPTDVALFIDRGGAAAAANGHQHLFLPFFGGQDDRLALRFVVQLCAGSNVSATVVRVKKTGPTVISSKGEKGDLALSSELQVPITVSPVFPDTIYASQSTQAHIASTAADDLLWSLYTRNDTAGSQSLPPDIRQALSRVTFTEVSSNTPLRSIIQRAKSIVDDNKRQNIHSLLLVSGRSRKSSHNNDHKSELESLVAEQSRSNAAIPAGITKTVGDVAAGFMIALPVVSGIMVLQSAGS